MKAVSAEMLEILRREGSKVEPEPTWLDPEVSPAVDDWVAWMGAQKRRPICGVIGGLLMGMRMAKFEPNAGP